MIHLINVTIRLSLINATIEMHVHNPCGQITAAIVLTYEPWPSYFTNSRVITQTDQWHSINVHRGTWWICAISATGTDCGVGWAWQHLGGIFMRFALLLCVFHRLVRRTVCATLDDIISYVKTCISGQLLLQSREQFVCVNLRWWTQFFVLLIRFPSALFY